MSLAAPYLSRAASRLRWRARALAFAGLCAPAAAADEAACRLAYVEAQRLQQSAELRAAQRQALACGQDECSPTVRSDCVEWLESIERALPSIVVDARGAGSEALTEVRVEADGVLLAERLDGRAISLDPGEHWLRFTHAGQALDVRSLIREGEKYRPVEVRFEHLALSSGGAEPAARTLAGGSEAEVDAPIPAVSYVLGGLGVLGVGVFAAFAVQGYESEQDLRERCAGACSARDVDAVQRRYLVADVGLGVGVAALAGALAVWYWRPPEPSVRAGSARGGSARPVGSASRSESRIDIGRRELSWSVTF